MEMKYIVVELQKNADGVVSHIVSDHATIAEAESKYYSILAYAAVSEVPVHSAIIVSEDGFPVRHQCYKHGQEVVLR
jgi:hypothetical protein